MNAHVACVVNDAGSNAVNWRVEWNVNGMVMSSFEGSVWTGMTIETDVPENSSVRLDVAAIGSDGSYAWASSDTLYTGSAPPPPPPPSATPPSLGSLSIMYWS